MGSDDQSATHSGHILDNVLNAEGVGRSTSIQQRLFSIMRL
jgi:hypothetical protein